LGFQPLTFLVQTGRQTRLLLAQQLPFLSHPGGLSLQFFRPLLELHDLALGGSRSTGELLLVILERRYMGRLIGKLLLQGRNLSAYVAQLAAQLALLALETVQLALKFCRTGGQRLALLLERSRLLLCVFPLTCLLIEVLLKSCQVLLHLVGFGLRLLSQRV